MVELMWHLRRRAGLSSGSVFGAIIKKISGRSYGLCQIMFGFSIPVSVRFFGDPIFPHGLSGIFISGNAEIGPNCIIFHQVTIGSNTLITSKGLGAPRVGAGCYLGAGAKIIGGITLGDNVVVGANAVVTRDVPSNSVVVGINHVLLRTLPHDTRFFTNGSPWQVISSSGTSEATHDEAARLDRAFSKK